MKRTTAASTFAVAMAVLILGIAPLARADDKGCSNATLKGTFAFDATGFVVAPSQFAGPFAGVGAQTFDGKGGTTATETVSVNGNILKLAITGTYTVNPDCTGSMTLSLAPVGLTAHLDFVIDDSGAEFRAIQTDPGAVLAGTGRRQFPSGDWRQ